MNKKVYIISPILIILFVFLYYFYFNRPQTPNTYFKTTVDTYKIVSSEYSTTRNFIFYNVNTGDVVTTMSVSNRAIGSPDYRIIEGKTHDWLTVTRIDEWGSGYIKYVDDVYFLNNLNLLEKAFSYESKRIESPNDNYQNEYLTTTIDNSNYSTKSAFDVLTTIKTCDETDNICKYSTSSKKYEIIPKK